MMCPRCGTAFDGLFCPRCGLPAAATPPVPAPAFQGVCPRCGTPFVGNFCPRCGLPAGAMATPERLSPGARRALTAIWTLAIAGFLVLIATNLIGLYLGPTYVFPGIAGLTRGASTDPGIDVGAAWNFVPLSGGASGVVATTGGNPGPYLRMTLPGGSAASGMWYEPIPFNGSAPYVAAADLDVDLQTSGTPFRGRLVVSVDPTPGPPDLLNATEAATATGSTTGWTSVRNVTVQNGDGSDRIDVPGTWYLKIAFYADSNPTNTVVGFDNVQLRWATDAYVFFFLPLPLPTLLFFSQDPFLFQGYYMFLVAAISLSVGYLIWRDRRLLRSAFLAPPTAIGTRLRSWSAWVAIAQAWMAAMFVQVVIIYLYIFVTGTEPLSPIGAPTSASLWTLFYEFAEASVYEELVFRALLIGVPMALGSLLLRASRTPTPNRPPVPLAHSLRYILGGNLRSTSSKEALLAAWALLAGSSIVFGLAHAPGWGWWKVVPAAVAGLAIGYLFLRHGIAAAILAHFATDYAAMVTYTGLGGDAGSLLLNLLFLGLALLGGGFVVWYAMSAWDHLSDLRSRFARASVARPPPVVYAPTPPVGWSAPTQAPPAYEAGPPPPTMSPGAPPAAAAPWTAPPAGRDPNAVPREYFPTYHPAPYGYPPVRFQCPSCGWVEARYDNGRFTCLRCGRTA